MLAALVTLAAALLLPRGGTPPPEPAPAPARRAPAAEGTPAMPRAPAPPASDAAPADEDPEATRRAELRALLEASIDEHLPDLKLSSDQLDAATDALLRLRAVRLELAALPPTPGNADRRRELRAALGEAAVDFEYVVGVDPAEFTEQISPEER